MLLEPLLAPPALGADARRVELRLELISVSKLQCGLVIHIRFFGKLVAVQIANC